MRRLTIVAVVVLTALLAPSPALAIDEVNTKRLRNAVTVSGILAHERIFQRIANQNGGTRASGTPGYDASAAYVKRRLEAAGYRVTEQQFVFPFFAELAPAELQQVSPTPTDYETGTFTFSGSGDVTGEVVAAGGIVIPPTPAPSSVSGCDPADFTPADPVEPQVALVQRGGCDFQVKAANAQAAGYDAVIIFNEGNPGRTDLFIGTLGRPFDIPVVGLSFEDAAALYTQVQAGPVVVRVATSTQSEVRPTTNVLADSPTGNADRVVVVGAQLDSVIAGPGINDNGSGSSTILEIAEEMAELGIRNRQKVRFAFWGAEELNLLGSEHYVATLSDDDLTKIVANLNFDMLGSTNYVRFVYDGDGSDTPDPGPPGSGQIEAVFNDYFASQGLATEPTAFDGRSDYGPFIAVGIPAGGLFSGAEGIKTAAQAAVYGGTAGVAYDPNYHQAGDTINNLSTKSLFELGDAA
ncbi:MAG TPA: M20/M25/M40 family metallo-hydrolase, partial [Actinomycetes bacterium]|nr:M20/M25/M40 family metallo-hydrolase [Actinomycetes bacterium]